MRMLPWPHHLLRHILDTFRSENFGEWFSAELKGSEWIEHFGMRNKWWVWKMMRMENDEDGKWVKIWNRRVESVSKSVSKENDSLVWFLSLSISLLSSFYFSIFLFPFLYFSISNWKILKRTFLLLLRSSSASCSDMRIVVGYPFSDHHTKNIVLYERITNFTCPSKDREWR